ncbi:solute carrier family 25 member 35 isoform X1 [Scyliorhinus canicula]|uniref:solute carrier family 25 member 35 isoform X1 n=1 Tax=Scyliorhinus canicula TaxID=7830 RepID=UPI0018F2E5AC|nr:solute carrier family 25 member 35 isoform X1 [Scyliorhinus canicula]
MDFLLAGLAACGACLFTNPLEVVKTRMQLQGELRGRGSYRLHYRNAFHATYTIWKVDGLAALQKGLLPALLYQFGMNGIRLGSYSLLERSGYTSTQGRNSGVKSIVSGALAGVAGAFLASPIYLVKTHLQAQSTIAVGHQYQHQGTFHALMGIYRRHGIVGLWRGASAAVPRVIVGSAAQLSTFSATKQFTNDLQVFKPDSWLVSLTSGMVSSIFVVFAMTPFDVISTRLYNQPVDHQGKGVFYRGYLDCFTKTVRKEGLHGLYKGTGASYFRVGPHTILSLFFWEELRKFYRK